MEDPTRDHSGVLYPKFPSNAEYTPRSTTQLEYLGSGILCIAVTSKIFDHTTMCLPRLSAE